MQLNDYSLVGKIGSGVCGFMLWGTWWAILPLTIYGALYGSTSDSRRHEAGHGTAFKTDWMNNVLYEIASFMVLRESTRWRWSHARHHSDTIIVGRDPEIAVTRPPNLFALLLRFFGINTTLDFFRHVLLHSTGRLTLEEKTFSPESEYGRVIFRARIYALIFANVIGLSIYTNSILPLMYIGLPVEGWIEICAGSFLQKEDVIRFDHEDKTYAIYRTAAADLYATDGSPQRNPDRMALKTYKVREHDGKIFLDLASGGGCGSAQPATP